MLKMDKFRIKMHRSEWRNQLKLTQLRYQNQLNWLIYKVATEGIYECMEKMENQSTIMYDNTVKQNDYCN